MPANSFNRQTAREKLASILSGALSGQVQAVYAYKVKSLIKLGKGPFVTVDSGPIKRVKNKYADSYDNDITLYVTTFVMWSDAESNWTEQNCEDRLDLLEKLIADALLDHKSQAQDATVPWDTIEFESPSTPDTWLEGGKQWWTETFTIRARKING
uniref:Tail protein n=1 Tax=Hot spring virus BHS1 TaxID=2024351 RepID=A0A2U7PC19_9VIRU|nr:hypothetical protein [Hot spring virus BHS1]